MRGVLACFGRHVARCGNGYCKLTFVARSGVASSLGVIDRHDLKSKVKAMLTVKLSSTETCSSLVHISQRFRLFGRCCSLRCATARAPTGLCYFKSILCSWQGLHGSVFAEF